MSKFTRLTQISVLALAVSSGLAHADSGRTRADVQGDFVQAQQSGALPSGFAALSARQVYASRAQDDAQLDPGQTQTVIRDELRAAQRAGEIRSSFLGWTAQELSRGDTAALEPGALRSRTAVRSALAAAQSADELPVGFVGRSLRTLYPGQYPMPEAMRNAMSSAAAVSLNEPK
jgi:hypothetical protein